LGAGAVVDGEIPRHPVLTIYRADFVAPAIDEREVLFADDVVLQDRAALGPFGVGNLDLGLQELRGALQQQHLLPVAVEDAELVREELVDPAEQPHGLLGRRLLQLADRADLDPRIVEDAVLVRHLYDLRLLREGGQVMTEQTRHGSSSPGLGLPRPRMSSVSLLWRP